MLSCWLIAPHCPEKSTCANAGPARAMNMNIPAAAILFTTSPLCGAWRRIPFRTVRLLLEMHRDNPWLLQVGWIFDDEEEKDSLLARLFRDEVPVFGHRGLGAVGDAVLPEVAGTQAGGL